MAKSFFVAADIPTPEFIAFSQGAFRELGAADALAEVEERLNSYLESDHIWELRGAMETLDLLADLDTGADKLNQLLIGEWKEKVRAEWRKKLPEITQS